MYCLNFGVDCSVIDVNVTPDKKTICLSNESIVLKNLEDCLKKVWGSDERIVQVGKSIDQYLKGAAENVEKGSPLKKQKMDFQIETEIDSKLATESSSDSFIENDVPERKTSINIPDSLV